MNPTRLPKIMMNWKPEGREKTRSSPKNPERCDIYSYEWKRALDRRMEQPRAMECGRGEALSDVVKPHNIQGVSRL